MITEEEMEALWKPYRHELSRDYVGLWQLVGSVQALQPELGDESVREVVLALVSRALATSEIEVGNQTRGVHGLGNVWHSDLDETIARIRREWIALGRNPNPGEIAWLQQPRQSSESNS